MTTVALAGSGRESRPGEFHPEATLPGVILTKYDYGYER